MNTTPRQSQKDAFEAVKAAFARLEAVQRQVDDVRSRQSGVELLSAKWHALQKECDILLTNWRNASDVFQAAVNILHKTHIELHPGMFDKTTAMQP